MPTINSIKESSVLDTPVALFDIVTHEGATFYLSTHEVNLNGATYQSRVLRHNTFDMTLGADSMTDGNTRVSITLANADSYFSGVDPSSGWKGASLTVRFGFFDVRTGSPTSETRILFRGAGGGVEELNETQLRLGFQSRLAMQRAWLPSIRLQRRCPWVFPATEMQRVEAATGGEGGSYSLFYRCGYSAGASGGSGNFDSGLPFTTCSYTRDDCAARGMLDEDGAGTATKRFGGFDVLPAPGEASTSSREGRSGAFAPLVYGTNWYDAPVVHVRADGKVVRAEAVLGVGPLQGVLRVVVNGYEVPPIEAGKDQTSTGFYRVASLGGRTGELNPDFGGSGSGPYGSFAFLSLGVPTTVAGSDSRIRVEVLTQGLILPRFTNSGEPLEPAFSANPAWILLDILRRAGWRQSELDVPRFATAAEYCDHLIPATDRKGNSIYLSRFRCNLALTARRSVGELLRGIRSANRLYFAHGHDGKLQLRMEEALRTQHAVKASGSNAVVPLNEGWPAYEFGDGTNGFSGIAREDNDASTLRLWSRPLSDSPNRVHISYSDEFNDYETDSLSVVEVDDAVRSGNEVQGAVQGLGVTNVHQALRIANLQLLKATMGNLYVAFETSVRGIGVTPGDIITLTYSREGFVRRPFRVLSVGMALNCSRISIVAQFHDDSWYSDTSGSIASGGGQRTYGADAPRPLLGSVLEPDGSTGFGISERVVSGADGGSTIVLSAEFLKPGTVSPAFSAVPAISPVAGVLTTGGTLSGDRTLYYGITAVDGSGGEGPLSALARAQLGAGTTHQVTLSIVTLPAEAVGINLYRGTDAHRLLRIASALPLGQLIVDPGMESQWYAPTDSRFDHANFYWRAEVSPPVAAQVFGGDSIGNLSQILQTNEHSGQIVRIISGRGAGQERTIRENTSITVTVTPQWQVVPDATSSFVIADSSWRLGARTAASPAEFEVPNREGLTIHVKGRAASQMDVESSDEAAPVTRWYLQGSPGVGGDSNPPPQPSFGVSVSGRGVVEISGISFPGLLNTRTVQSGTLTLYYWNELLPPSPYVLTETLNSGEVQIVVSPVANFVPGDVLQVGTELLVVQEVQPTVSTYQVSRGELGTTQQTHSSGASVLRLSRKSYIVPFPRDFFGSPASGLFSFPVILPSARLAAAEMFVTNDRGNSPSRSNAYNGFADGGLRTFSGGQYTLQVDGLLAIHTGAAPPLTVEDARSVRDITARVSEAPTGSPITMLLRKGGSAYCTLSIAAGSTVSDALNGLPLLPLNPGDVLSLDITSVGIGANDFPGRDLTVTIRL